MNIKNMILNIINRKVLEGTSQKLDIKINKRPRLIHPQLKE